jgi:hypothetical protein
MNGCTCNDDLTGCVLCNENKKKANSFLNNLKNWFGFTKKEILYIKVSNGFQRFTCKNPKKILFWKTLAEKQARFSLMKGSETKVRIEKVVYK